MTPPLWTLVAVVAYVLIGFCCVACKRCPDDRHDVEQPSSTIDSTDAWYMLFMWPAAALAGIPRALISLCGGRWG